MNNAKHVTTYSQMNKSVVLVLCCCCCFLIKASCCLTRVKSSRSQLKKYLSFQLVAICYTKREWILFFRFLCACLLFLSSRLSPHPRSSATTAAAAEVPRWYRTSHQILIRHRKTTTKSLLYSSFSSFRCQFSLD